MTSLILLVGLMGGHCANGKCAIEKKQTVVKQQTTVVKKEKKVRKFRLFKRNKCK